MIRRKTVVAILIIGILISWKPMQAQQVEIAGSQIKKFTSSIVSGQEYVLQIMLPSGYAQGDKKYPVVYLMDSQWDFQLLTALYGEQYYDGFIPELIIVGITWGDHPNPDSLRARDYTPTNEKRLAQSGGADKFLSVIKNEVFPLVESNYRVDANDKTLVGCSLGGLFSMYTLFTHPDMFNRYVAASPAFTWDNNVLYKYEEKYHAGTSNPSSKLFMCVGGVERGVPGFNKLTAYMRGRNYDSLRFQSMVLENTGHSGTKGEGYARGLQYVFERPSIKLPTEILNSYNGIYEMPDGSSFEIKTEGGNLVIYQSANNKFSLLAEDENNFYSTAEFLNLHFEKDENKTVTGFQMKTYGSSIFIKRIK